MSTELSVLHDRVNKETTLKLLAEEEAVQLKLMIQAAQAGEQILQQKVQELSNVVDRFKTTTALSVNEVLNRLKLDLNLGG